MGQKTIIRPMTAEEVARAIAAGAATDAKLSKSVVDRSSVSVSVRLDDNGNIATGAVAFTYEDEAPIQASTSPVPR